MLECSVKAVKYKRGLERCRQKAKIMEENVRDLSNPVEFKSAFPVEHKECRVQ